MSLDTPAPPPTDPPPPPPPPSLPTKRKRKHKESPHILHQHTFRKPPYTYFHLALITPGTASISRIPSSNPASSHAEAHIDPLTALPLLTSALQAYLGTTGAAIPIDILKTAGRNVWIRVPRDDARGVRAGLSSWIGSCEGDRVPGVEEQGGSGRVKVAWRVVREEGSVLGVGGGDGGDLFGA